MSKHFCIIQVFAGNFDGSTIVTNQLKNPVRAMCVRLIVVAYHSHPSLRFGLIGKAAAAGRSSYTTSYLTYKYIVIWFIG